MENEIQLDSVPGAFNQLPSPAKSRKRSVTVGIAGLFMICLGLGIGVIGLAAGVYLIPFMLKDASRTHGGVMVQIAETAGLWIPAALAICLGQPFVRVGCGLFERQNWCRVVIVIVGAAFVLFGAFNLFHGKYMLGIFSAIWGLWWAVFFTTKSVRSQFSSKTEMAVSSSKAENDGTFRAAFVISLLLAAGVSFISMTIAGVLAYAIGVAFFVAPAFNFLIKPLKPRFPNLWNWTKGL
jgi:hypothetical protein